MTGTRGYNAAVIGALGVLLAVLFFRLGLSIDLQDETLYVALPYSFLHGKAPFADEILLSQGFGVVSLPAVWLHHLLFGRQEYLVLFLRVAFVVAHGILAAAVYVNARLRGFQRGVSLLCAASPLFFAPFAIYSFSYNTIAVAGIGATLFLRSCGVLTGKRRYLVGALSCAAAAVLAYPPIAAPLAVAEGMLWWRTRKNRSSALMEAVACIGAIAFPFLALIAVTAWFGAWERMQDIYRYSASFSVLGPSLGKMTTIFGQLVEYLPRILLFATAAAALLYCRRALYRLVAALFAGGVGAFVLLRPGDVPIFHLAHIGLTLALLSLLWGRKIEPTFRWIVLALFVCGMFTTLVSSNGLFGYSVGAGWMVPAFLIALASPGGSRDEGCRPGHAFLGFVMLSVFFLAGAYRQVYGDESVSALNSRIPSGAFRGIATTPWKADLIQSLMEDLRLSPSDASFFALDLFPAAYFLSDAVPAGPSVWIYPENIFRHDRQTLRKYAVASRLPDVILTFERLPITAAISWPVVHGPEDSLYGILSDFQYGVFLKRDPYMLWRRHGK